MRRRIGGALVQADALFQLARTSWLFKLRGRKAVAEATRAAMHVAPADPARVMERRHEVWRADRSLRRAASVWPLRVACLQHALALQALLRRSGLSSRVSLGSRLEDGELAAHAWVELGDLRLDAHGGAEGFHAFPAPAASQPLEEEAADAEERAT